MKSVLTGSMMALCAVSATLAQAPRPATPQGPPPKEDALDPSPINAATDPDLNLFINDWRKANPEQIKYRFVADYTKSKASSSKRKENNETITTERWECNMKLTNQSGQTLEGVTVDKVTRPAAGKPFAVATSRGAFTADQVVVASGGYHKPIVPRLADKAELARNEPLRCSGDVGNNDQQGLRKRVNRCVNFSHFFCGIFVRDHVPQFADVDHLTCI